MTVVPMMAPYKGASLCIRTTGTHVVSKVTVAYYGDRRVHKVT